MEYTKCVSIITTAPGILYLGSEVHIVSFNKSPLFIEVYKRSS